MSLLNVQFTSHCLATETVGTVYLLRLRTIALALPRY
jgi:hypothetical protein